MRNPKGDGVCPVGSGKKPGVKRANTRKKKAGGAEGGAKVIAIRKRGGSKAIRAEKDGTGVKDSEPKPRKPGEGKQAIDIKEIIRKAKPEIIEKLVEQAKSGSIQHVKLVLELYPEVGSEVEQEEKQTLAELLLKELNGEGAETEALTSTEEP